MSAVVDAAAVAVAVDVAPTRVPCSSSSSFPFPYPLTASQESAKKNWSTPASLFQQALRASVEGVTRFNLMEQLLDTPICVSEQVVCHLRGRHLADYIDIRGGFAELDKHFSMSATQRVLIRLLSEKANLGYDKPLRTRFKAIETTFARVVRKKKHRLIKSVACLQLTQAYPQVKINKNALYKYFRFKENMFVGVVRFNKPKFQNTELASLIPDTQTTHELANKESASCYKIKLNLPARKGKCLFLNQLRGMARAFEKLRHHEVLAFGFGLISTTRFARLLKLRPFLVEVYGMLAVSLASYNVEPSAAFGCLAKAEKYVKFESCRLNVALYRQQVFATYDQFKEEKKCFEQLYRSEFRPPVQSELFFRLVTVHVESRCRRIENLLAKMCLHRNFHDRNKPYNTINCVLMERTKKKINNLQCLLGEMSSLIRGMPNRLTDILSLYKAAAYGFEGAVHIINDWVATHLDVDLLVVANKLLDRSAQSSVKFTPFLSGMQVFFQHINRSRENHTATYDMWHRNALVNTTMSVEKTSRLKMTLESGNMYFSNVVLLMAVFKKTTETEFVDLVQDTATTYAVSTNHKHYRIVGLKQLANIVKFNWNVSTHSQIKLESFVPAPLSFQLPNESDVTAIWIVKQDQKRISELVRFGIDSIVKFSRHH